MKTYVKLQSLKMAVWGFQDVFISDCKIYNHRNQTVRYFKHSRNFLDDKTLKMKQEGLKQNNFSVPLERPAESKTKEVSPT